MFDISNILSLYLYVFPLKFAFMVRFTLNWVGKCKRISGMISLGKNIWEPKPLFLGNYRISTFWIVLKWTKNVLNLNCLIHSQEHKNYKTYEPLPRFSSSSSSFQIYNKYKLLLVDTGRLSYGGLTWWFLGFHLVNAKFWDF